MISSPRFVDDLLGSEFVLERFDDTLVLLPLPLMIAANLYVGRGLLRAFYDTKGLRFAIAAALYYAFVFPLAVGAGALAGAVRSFGPDGRR